MLLRDLEWLVTLSEHGHVTKAAQALGVPQPTLSRALARLEQELGCALFERVPAGLVETPEGALAVAAARDASGRLQQLTAELRARRDPDSGLVRLAFLDSLATSLVPRILGDFHRLAPRVRVALTQEPGHEIKTDLDEASVDLAVTSTRHRGPYGWLPLQRERLVVIVPPTHRLRRRKRVGLAELGGDELVTTPPGFGFRELVTRLQAEAGTSFPVSFESGDLGAIEGLVSAGLGIGIVPEQFAGLTGSVPLALDTPSAVRTIALTWRTDRPLTPPARRLRAMLAEGWAA
ncbi:LysR family transcriptional regulator [Nocardioides sp. GY 10127]|uniref:LysR family transcriptional regulator n=1 Tax=Nocardioides sp. GY 10127 TaxID=2569762 RepID=UPI0010A7D671|nr:LysR family transcriptional regulator [Nocardioides sp. GY 10127]TIC80037.1 LysR family transcriptional regulator [Nocardioides sp. GY 10127]